MERAERASGSAAWARSFRGGRLVEEAQPCCPSSPGWALGAPSLLSAVTSSISESQIDNLFFIFKFM